MRLFRVCIPIPADVTGWQRPRTYGVASAEHRNRARPELQLIVRRPGPRVARPLAARRPRLGAAAAASAYCVVTVLLLVQAARIIGHYEGVVRNYGINDPVLGGSDFPAFYMGAKLMVSSQRQALYDEEAQAREVVSVKGYGDDLSHDSTWFRYYNPPAYSVLIAPLAVLPVRQAYLVTVTLNLVGAAALAWLMGAILRWRQPLTAIAIGTLVTSETLLYSFWQGQPSLLLATVIGAAFLLAERRRSWSAGAVLALAGVKPQWLVLPALSVFRTRPRAVFAFAATTALMLLPFLTIGTKGASDFIHLVRARGQGDIHDDGFAEAVLSWSGFFRAYAGSVRPEAWAAFSLLTLLAYLPIWASGKADLLPMGAVLGTLLVGPHSHPQDWLLIAPAACFLLRNHSGARLWTSGGLLLSIWWSLNRWSGLAGSETAVYWPTLAGFATLLWVWALAVEADLRVLVLLERGLSPLRARNLARAQRTAF